MVALNTIMLFIPILAYIGLVIAVKTGRLASLYLFAAVTLATIILGVVSISLIKPISPSVSDLRGLAVNLIAVTYISAMLYGSYFGARVNDVERVIVGGFLIVLISIVSAVM